MGMDIPVFHFSDKTEVYSTLPVTNREHDRIEFEGGFVATPTGVQPGKNPPPGTEIEYWRDGKCKLRYVANSKVTFEGGQQVGGDSIISTDGDLIINGDERHSGRQEVIRNWP